MLLGVLDYATLYFVHLTRWAYLPPSSVDLNCTSGSKAWGSPYINYCLVSSQYEVCFSPWFFLFWDCVLCSHTLTLCVLPILMWLGTVAGSGPRNWTGVCPWVCMWMGGGRQQAVPKCYFRKIEDGSPGRDSRNWPDCLLTMSSDGLKWDLSFQGMSLTCFTDSSWSVYLKTSDKCHGYCSRMTAWPPFDL